MVLEEDPNEPDQPKLYIEFYDDPGGAIPACEKIPWAAFSL